MSRLVFQVDLLKVVQRIMLKEVIATKVVMVAKVNVAAKVKVEVKIATCQSTKILYAIAAKR